MMNGREFVCSSDDEVLRTEDREVAVRFLAGSSDEAALKRADRFLRAVTPLALSTTTPTPTD